MVRIFTKKAHSGSGNDLMEVGIMAKEIRTIGVLTSGGDAPGMNAAIRAVVRVALSKGLKVRGIRRGFHDFCARRSSICPHATYPIRSSVEARSSRLRVVRRCARKRDSRKRLRSVKKYGIDGLIVIGGDGLFLRGAQKLANLGVRTVGIPGTIDLDIACTIIRSDLIRL